MPLQHLTVTGAALLRGVAAAGGRGGGGGTALRGGGCRRRLVGVVAQQQAQAVVVQLRHVQLGVVGVLHARQLGGISGRRGSSGGSSGGGGGAGRRACGQGEAGGDRRCAARNWLPWRPIAQGCREERASGQVGFLVSAPRAAAHPRGFRQHARTMLDRGRAAAGRAAKASGAAAPTAGRGAAEARTHLSGCRLCSQRSRAPPRACKAAFGGAPAPRRSERRRKCSPAAASCMPARLHCRARPAALRQQLQPSFRLTTAAARPLRRLRAAGWSVRFSEAVMKRAAGFLRAAWKSKALGGAEQPDGCYKQWECLVESVQRMGRGWVAPRGAASGGGRATGGHAGFLATGPQCPIGARSAFVRLPGSETGGLLGGGAQWAGGRRESAKASPRGVQGRQGATLHLLDPLPHHPHQRTCMS